MTADKQEMVARNDGPRQTDERLWDTADVVAYLGLSRETINRKRASGELPYLKIGRAVRYKPSDIEAWADAQRAA